MCQVLESLPDQQPQPILCCYVNPTRQMQIARMSDVPNRYLECVVFPGERFVFESIPDAHLEIYTGTLPSSLLADRISCDRLAYPQETCRHLHSSTR